MMEVLAGITHLLISIIILLLVAPFGILLWLIIGLIKLWKYIKRDMWRIKMTLLKHKA